MMIPVYVPKLDTIGVLIGQETVLLEVYVPTAVLGKAEIDYKPMTLAYKVPENEFEYLEQMEDL